MKLIDGFKTYLGIFIGFVSSAMTALDANLISTAIGVGDQGSAWVNIAFITIGALLATYGRVDAQRKINNVK